MANKPLTARERLLEVIHILQEYTDEKTMLTIHEVHGFFPEHITRENQFVQYFILSIIFWSCQKI